MVPRKTFCNYLFSLAFERLYAQRTHRKTTAIQFLFSKIQTERRLHSQSFLVIFEKFFRKHFKRTSPVDFKRTF